MRNRIIQMSWAAFIVFFIVRPVFAGPDQVSCFYLDKLKIKGELASVTLLATINSEAVHLEKSGLFKNNKRICQWSLNGGSGTKETFSLNGEYAVPILNPACEEPFGHQETGVGFGDWYLTLCGTAIDKNLLIETNGRTYSVPLSALTQWTRYESGDFPIEGDSGD